MRSVSAKVNFTRDIVSSCVVDTIVESCESEALTGAITFDPILVFYILILFQVACLSCYCARLCCLV